MVVVWEISGKFFLSLLLYKAQSSRSILLVVVDIVVVIFKILWSNLFLAHLQVHKIAYETWRFRVLHNIYYESFRMLSHTYSYLF